MPNWLGLCPWVPILVCYSLRHCISSFISTDDCLRFQQDMSLARQPVSFPPSPPCRVYSILYYLILRVTLHWAEGLPIFLAMCLLVTPALFLFVASGELRRSVPQVHPSGQESWKQGDLFPTTQDKCQVRTQLCCSVFSLLHLSLPFSAFLCHLDDSVMPVTGLCCFLWDLFFLIHSREVFFSTCPSACNH